MVKIPKFSGNLLLGVGLVAAAFFLTREIRGAGRDLAAFGEQFKPFEGFEFPKIEFPEFKFPEIKFPDFFGKPADDISDIAGDVIDVGNGTTITIPAETVVDPITGVVTSPTPPLLDLGADARARALEALRLGRIRAQKELDLAAIPPEEDIGRAELVRARNEAEFRRRQQERREREQRAGLPVPDIPSTTPRPTTVESLLPTQQQFLGGGVSFIGGTIRENPIDTLAEVIEFFPELSASQAADFLAETRGQILPSQAQFIDPDVRNIAIAGGDFPTSIQVQTSPLETLSIRESQNIRAAQFTCEQFGLNCELVESSMA